MDKRLIRKLKSIHHKMVDHGLDNRARVQTMREENKEVFQNLAHGADCCADAFFASADLLAEFIKEIEGNG